MSSSALVRNKASKDFSRIPRINLPRSVFKMGCTNKTALDVDKLYPLFCKEVVPGDTWDMEITQFTRMTTQKVPSLDNLKLDTYFFFVPSRLVWEHFVNQHGERENPDDTIDYITPTITTENGFEEESIYDYFDVPTKTPALTISALPLRAYNLIYNTYFRDENLQDSLPLNKTDSDDSEETYKIVKKCKVSDYFTRALPEIQKGDPVMLPIGTTAPVYGDNNALALFASQTGEISGINQIQGTNNTYLQAWTNRSGKVGDSYSGDANRMTLDKVAGVVTKEHLNSEYNTGGFTSSGLIADLSEALGASITAVRQAIATQELLERDNRNGTRYTEQLEGRYGVTNPDLRLMRPEYLGGTSDWLSQIPVTQTSSTDNTSPQANLTAYSLTGGNGKVISKSFGEFGYVIGLACIQGIPSYQQGLDRMWTRFLRYDYYYPEFAGLSDQAILNREIFCQGSNVKDENGNIVDEQPFGYQERYAEYRNWKNTITGKMRSNSDTSLDVYHYAEEFENLPVLNEEFVESSTPIQRSLAVTNEPQFFMDIAFDAVLYRSMPVYGFPSISSNLTMM